jgi:HAD superfamily hydrolase (TIGR01509 family)
MQRNRLFVWDIDGVLIWHDTDPARDWRAVLIERGALEVWERFQDSELWRECLTSREQDVNRALERFLKHEPDPRTDGAELIQLWLNNNNEINIEAFECMRSIRAAGYSCAIASDQDRLRADRMKALFNSFYIGDLPYFFSCDVGMIKIDADYYRKLESLLGKTAGEISLIDNNPANIAAARKAGWSAELITPGYIWDHFYREVMNETV